MSPAVRLGGMALANGVLVHGPSSWACAVRPPDGRLRLASGAKRVRSSEVDSPLVRGPARIAEVIALLPTVKRALPEARLPFLEARVVGAMVGTALGARGVRRSRLGPAAQEALSAALSFVPAALALRGTPLAAYHGAEHISIGSYEHGEARPREHERCGSHMVGPLLAVTTLGNLAVTRAGGSPRALRLGRLGVAVGSLAAATELFGWMLRHPEHSLSRALAWPGAQLQSRFLTAEPSEDQLEVARSALAECLRLEESGAAERTP